MSVRRLLAALALAVGAVATAAPAAVRAAGPAVEWGTPTGSAHFGQGLSFSQHATLPGGLARLEALVTVPGAVGPLVVDETDQAGPGSTTLRYEMASADSALLPNTDVSVRWRATGADGSVAVGPALTVRYADDRFAWQTKAGALVRVHWYQGDAAFGDRALRIAEQGIAKAEQLLGVTETAPVDFFVYADQASFYDALGPGTRENVGGEAVSEIRTLFGLITPAEVNASWVSIVIPHELTHLVFDTAVHNPYHFPPRWLNEGLAVYLSQGYAADDRGQVEDAARSDELMPLTALASQFPTTRDRFSLAYAESVSAIDFLVRHDGRDALVRLIRSYASGVTDDEAFRSALGVDVAGFEQAWLSDLGASAPRRVGPQPAPAGPLPSGWGAGTAGAAGSPGAGASAGAASPASSVAFATVAPGAVGSRATPNDEAGRTDVTPVAVAAVIVGAAAVLVGLTARRRRVAPRAGVGGPGVGERRP